MEIIYLFYIGSYSHLIVSDAIINEKHLPLGKVLFVTYRGVKLPKCYEGNLLYDETNIGSRVKFFFKNYRRFKLLTRKKIVRAYLPFQQEFPVFKLFDEYYFFEEGLSAYDTSLNFSVFNRKRFLKLTFKQHLLALFFDKNMRGLYNGITNGSPFSFECTLVGLTKESYKNILLDNCHYEMVQFTGKPLNKSEIKNSVIIVMDSTHASDRMNSADNYLQILSDVLKNYDFKSRDIFLKLHPDNYRDKAEALSLIKKYLNFIEFEEIDESLEDIALSNQNNTFIGNHSTILFYAPIYGNSNESISLARITAERDSTYCKWVKRWGGIDGLINLIQKEVHCL